MARRRRNSKQRTRGAPPPEGSPGAAMPDHAKLQEILDRASGSERHGFKFGLFPIWVQEYDLSNEETARLIAMARERE